MSQPLIGITTRQAQTPEGLQAFSLLRAYVEAVLEAGGMPLLIPVALPASQAAPILDRVDALILSGGGDIHPQFFPGMPHPLVDGLDIERDALELTLARRAVEKGKPLLGICRGCQVLNVALGGTLYTHLPDQLENSLEHSLPGTQRRTLAHTVRIRRDSRLGKILGEQVLQVNSLHHQGVAKLGEGLQASAWAEDGLIEGIELEDRPFVIGVQWHPEWLTDQEPMRRLFRQLVLEASSQ
ncbi:MAG: gamma-glutamyl-gamma-aminobutyrate hydrolase family protein [Anaerolineales bacterium]